MKSNYDVVVIGSGFGGAITACRLAQAGKKVCILEKGKRWTKTDFPRASGQVAEHAVWDQNQPGYKRNGFIEYVSFPNMDVVQGVGVGGGSLHYFNVHIQPPEFIMESDKWPESVTLKKLQPYYKLAANMLAAKKLTPPEGRALPPRTEVFRDAVEKLTNQEAELVPICVHVGDDKFQSPGGQSQDACIYCGDCLLGCQVNSKNTLDLNYIPIAEQHGAEVYPEHQALKITPQDGGYEILYKVLGVEGYNEGQIGTLQAKQVVLGAGTLGTNELLLRCKNEFKTLPNLSPQLGKRYSGNGDFLFAGAYVPKKVVDAGSGPSITAGVGFVKGNNEEHIFIEDLGLPNEFLWYFNGKFPRPRQIFRTIKELIDYLDNSVGLFRYIEAIFGKNADFELKKFFDAGYFGHFMPYLGMGTDAANGRLHIKKGKLKLDWSFRKSKSMFNNMIKHMKEISRAADGKFINSFLWSNPLNLFNLPFLNLGKTLTAHPLGGCVMSDSPEQGVANEWGEVWGYPGLFVADGALVPSAISVNPSATICALAERVAFHMIHNRELEENDELTPVNYTQVSEAVSAPKATNRKKAPTEKVDAS